MTTPVTGKKLGRYEIIRTLGKGAMGLVYEGQDPVLQRHVAIKTIIVEKLDAKAAEEYEFRFRTEALAAARLLHPNIVPIFDFGRDEEVAYLVMQFIDGDDLKHHLDNGEHFSTAMVISMILDLLAALDHAHENNIVHRDVKPGNMLIEKGRVKLMDFGVARIQDPDAVNRTQIGAAGIGTPRYMSPEQAQGQRVDARSDLFAAGVVLYELLTGVRPFDGDNPFAVIHQIVNTLPPPPTYHNPKLPRSIDAVVAKALAKNRDERFSSAREFALALKSAGQRIGSGG
ncbi:MAG: serine/threonine protein kinase, partial [Ramlibacter sp.]|nr:serine/threonine protein kinase [Ramlibacter sp.]